MNLPRPNMTYRREDEVLRNQALLRADEQNLKRGRDVEMGDGRVILTSENGTRYSLTVDNSGTLSATAL